MLPAVHCVDGVFGQPRGRGRHSHRAERRTAQSRSALGDNVYVLFHCVGKRVEQLVKLVKMHTLDVPVGLFGLSVQIRRVSQLLIEQGDGFSPDIRGEIVLC